MKKYLGLLLFLSASLFANDCTFNPVSIPPPTPEAISFYRSGNVLWIVQNLWAIAIPALIFFSGFSAKIRSFCQRVTSKWFFETALYSLLFLSLVSLLNIPLSFYANYIRPHSYGMSNQSLALWFKNFIIGNMITVLLGMIVVWIVYGIIKKSPKRSWLYFGLLTFPLAVFMVIVQPIWIAPLFNKFELMKDSELKTKILTLAERAGIEGGRVYEVDMSAQSKAINAYVTGIGTSKRIVLWDTAIEGLTENELLFVMGHEMGHYVLHHLWWGLLVGTLFSTFIFWLVFIFAKLILRSSSRKWSGVPLRDVASFPLLIAFYIFFSTLLSPAENLFSQSIEHQADTFGLELTHLNHAAGTGFVKIQSNNLGYPWPGAFFLLYRSGHPSIGSRITFFNTYKPWCEGKPLKYGRYFKEQ